MLKKILKGSMYVFIFKMFGAVAVFLITLIISKNAGPATLGKFQLLSKLVLIGSVFATLGLDMFAVRKISEVGNTREPTLKFINRSIFSILIFSSLIALIVFLLRNYMERTFFKIDGMTSYIFLAGITVFFYSGYSFLCQVFRGFGSVKAYAFFRYSWLHVFFILTLVILFLLKGMLEERFIFPFYFGCIAVSFVVVFLFSREFMKRKEFEYENSDSKMEIRHDIKKSLPMMLSSSLSFITAYADIFIIGYFLSTYYVGIYTGIQQFMLIFTFVSVALSAYTSPLLAKSHIENDLKLLRSLYLHSILTGAILLIPVFIILTFFPSPILQITFGNKYVPYSQIMSILAIGFFVNALSGPVISMMNMTNNQSKLVLFSLCNVVFSFLLTAILTWKFSLTGAAFASCITNVVFRVFLFYYITNFIATEKKNNSKNKTISNES